MAVPLLQVGSERHCHLVMVTNHSQLGAQHRPEQKLQLTFSLFTWTWAEEIRNPRNHLKHCQGRAGASLTREEGGTWSTHIFTHTHRWWWGVDLYIYRQTWPAGPCQLAEIPILLCTAAARGGMDHRAPEALLHHQSGFTQAEVLLIPCLMSKFIN